MNRTFHIMLGLLILAVLLAACTAGAGQSTPTPQPASYSDPFAYCAAVVTGHATVYECKSAGGKPAVVKQVFTADARGFVADFWFKLTW